MGIGGERKRNEQRQTFAETFSQSSAARNTTPESIEIPNKNKERKRENVKSS